jgi:hypothetical protein
MNEQKEFYSIDEIEKLVSRNRGTVYNRIKLLGIQTHKFEMDRHTYVAAEDVERIKKVIEKPWMAQELKKVTSEESEPDAA